MSLTVEVMRGAGDIPGPPITCNYFASELVFRQRGRVEIDKAAQGGKLVSVTLAGVRGWIRPGQIIRLVDEGRDYRARVRSIAYSHGRDSDGKPYATCSLELRFFEI